MSDPVNTDALRNPPWSNLDAVGSLLDAAADEIDRIRAAAYKLDAVRAEVIRYAGWHEQSPEDSWRFERDLRTALDMEQYSGDER